MLAPLTRCLMVGLAQEDLWEDPHILRSLAAGHSAQFGVSALVEVGGWVETGQRVLVE